MINFKKIFVAAVVAISMVSMTGAVQAQTLDQLLQEIRSDKAKAQAEQQRRVNEFRNNRDQQRALMNDIERQVAEQDALSARLSRSFDANEVRLTELETQLANRLGDLGEVVGVVRQIASDSEGLIGNSIISAGQPDRAANLSKLANSVDYPSIEELEGMWLTLMDEIVESGKVTTSNMTIRDADGRDQQAEVVRVGTFNAVSDGDYLGYSSSDKKFYVLPSQPEDRYTSTAADLSTAGAGSTTPFAIDPSGGVILEQIIKKATPAETVEYGGLVGYIILALGLVGVLIAIWRLFVLTGAGAKIRSQAKNPTAPKKTNALGRILSAYHENKEVDTDTLELKMDEAILKETPRLEQWQGSLKIIAAIAPLLGLLGTVIGMIETFEMITLFGAGDPKQMASGISKALVTTMLGLIVAIPIVLLHSWVSSKSKGLIEILEEQSAGLIAKHAEKR